MGRCRRTGKSVSFHEGRSRAVSEEQRMQQRVFWRRPGSFTHRQFQGAIGRCKIVRATLHPRGIARSHRISLALGIRVYCAALSQNDGSGSLHVLAGRHNCCPARAGHGARDPQAATAVQATPAAARTAAPTIIGPPSTQTSFAQTGESIAAQSASAPAYSPAPVAPTMVIAAATPAVASSTSAQGATPAVASSTSAQAMGS